MFPSLEEFSTVYFDPHRIQEVSPPPKCLPNIGCHVCAQSLSCVRLFATPWTLSRQPLEFAQTHVHWVSNAIQPSHPLSSPSPPTFNLSQHQGLFWWVSSGQSIGVLASASVLPMNIQDWFPLGWTVGSPCSPRDSQESSLAPRFKSINSLVLVLLYGTALTSIWDSVVAQMVQSLGWGNPLEKEMATHSSILLWRIPLTGEPGRLQSTQSQRVRHYWATNFLTSIRDDWKKP